MAVVSYVSSAKLVSLLTAADPKKNLNVRVLSATRLSLETSTFQQVATIDLAEEKIISGADDVEVMTAHEPSSRRGGEYKISAFGESSVRHSLKDLLASGLNALEANRPGTLDKLSKIKKTTKRIVAHDPKKLFESESLADKFAAPLATGWWYGTNNSKQETEAWLKLACECADVKWNSKDFTINV